MRYYAPVVAAIWRRGCLFLDLCELRKQGFEPIEEARVLVKTVEELIESAPVLLYAHGFRVVVCPVELAQCLRDCE